MPKSAGGGRAEREQARVLRRQPEPSRRQNTQDMAVTEKRDISAGLGGACNDRFRTRRHLLDALSIGNAISPKRPIWVHRVNLCRGPAFVRAVIPFAQVGLDLRGVSVPGQLAGFAGALERAGQNERKSAPADL